MRCYCCDAEVKIGRKVKLRPWRDFDPEKEQGYEFYEKEMTYRWAFVCLQCYRNLDSADGRAMILGKAFNIAGASRGDKASVIDEKKYQTWQRLEAEKMGLQGPE